MWLSATNNWLILPLCSAHSSLGLQGIIHLLHRILDVFYVPLGFLMHLDPHYL